jgi:GxxExxY protein
MRLPEGVREVHGPNLSNGKYPLKETTERIIGCAVRVHKELQGGFVEEVYERAMVHELRKSGLQVERQRVFPVTYDGVLVGEHRADMIVNESVAVELKAVRQLTDQHSSQLLSTMKAARTKVGLLINFNEARLVNGVRRFVL